MIKAFTILCGCCPLLSTPFRNFVGSRMFTQVERVTSYLHHFYTPRPCATEHTARAAIVVDVYYRSVPQIRPPFATLALVQSAGGAYTRDAIFSLAITPSLHREMFGDSVDAWNARRRDATDASGRLASFSVEGRGTQRDFAK